MLTLTGGTPVNRSDGVEISPGTLAERGKLGYCGGIPANTSQNNQIQHEKPVLSSFTSRLWTKTEQALKETGECH